MTTTTVPYDTDDPRAIATASVQRVVSDFNVQHGGSAVAIGGGYFLSAGHVMFDSSMPTQPKTAQAYDFIAGRGLQSPHTASIFQPSFSSDIRNMGWGQDGTDISLLHTPDQTSIDTPMLVYADPSDAAGVLATFGYPSQQGYDGGTMVRVDGAQSANAHLSATLSNRQTYDVLVSDAGAHVIGGQSGSGVWLTNDVDGDGVHDAYLAGIVTLDIALVAGQSAIGYEPLGDVYAALTEMIETTGESASSFARATLVSGQTSGSTLTEVAGSLLHEDLIGSVNADILSGMAGSDVLFGGAAGDILNGGEGNDRLWGGEGNDTLTDGSGKDNLIGGAGHDVFVLSADNQADAIKDFDTAEDLIDVSAWGVTSFADLRIDTHGTGKSILRYGSEATSVNDGSWTLSADQFTANHFVFATSTAVTLIEGTDGNDKLFGTSLNEDLRDGAGIDNLWGRAGADIFTLSADGQADTIKDFHVGIDQIDVSAWGATSFAELDIDDHASGKSILRYGNEALSINDGTWTLPASSFSADDFIFA